MTHNIDALHFCLIGWYRRKGVLAPVGGDAEDPLGLDVESSGGGGFPEEQLQASHHLCFLISQ